MKNITQIALELQQCNTLEEYYQNYLSHRNLPDTLERRQFFAAGAASFSGLSFKKWSGLAKEVMNLTNKTNPLN